MKTPNVKDIKKWCKALRSGIYAQDKGCLHSKSGYCCLGVACDVFIKKKDIELDDGLWIKGWMPDQQLMAPAWLKNINDHFTGLMDIGLIALNDGSYLVEVDKGYWDENKHAKFTFDEIADLLELVYVHNALG